MSQSQIVESVPVHIMQDVMYTTEFNAMSTGHALVKINNYTHQQKDQQRRSRNKILLRYQKHSIVCLCVAICAISSGISNIVVGADESNTLLMLGGSLIPGIIILIASVLGFMIYKTGGSVRAETDPGLALICYSLLHFLIHLLCVFSSIACVALAVASITSCTDQCQSDKIITTSATTIVPLLAAIIASFIGTCFYCCHCTKLGCCSGPSITVGGQTTWGPHITKFIKKLDDLGYINHTVNEDVKHATTISQNKVGAIGTDNCVQDSLVCGRNRLLDWCLRNSVVSSVLATILILLGIINLAFGAANGGLYLSGGPFYPGLTLMSCAVCGFLLKVFGKKAEKDAYPGHVYICLVNVHVSLLMLTAIFCIIMTVVCGLSAGFCSNDGQCQNEGAVVAVNIIATILLPGVFFWAFRALVYSIKWFEVLPNYRLDLEDIIEEQHSIPA